MYYDICDIKDGDESATIKVFFSDRDRYGELCSFYRDFEDHFYLYENITISERPNCFEIHVSFVCCDNDKLFSVVNKKFIVPEGIMKNTLNGIIGFFIGHDIDKMILLK